ncbi:PAS domain S-box protein [Nitrospirota bacterium]
MDFAAGFRTSDRDITCNGAAFRHSFELAAVGMVHTDPSGKWIRVNRKFCEITGYSPDELMELSFKDITHPDDLKENLHFFEPLLSGEIKTYSTDKRYIRKDGSPIWVNLTVSLVRKPSGEPDFFISFVNDISDRKQLEERQSLSIMLLEYINQSDQKTDMVKGITSMIKQSVGIESVGVRLRDGEDYPYYHSSGFPARFVEAESSLCARDSSGALVRDPQGKAVLECMCGTVISSQTDPSQPCFTPGGSFWTNSTSELLASTSENEQRARTRNRCNSEGYESVALIPLRSRGEIVGLLQLNDRRREMFTLETVEFLEGIASSIGISFQRMQTKEALRRGRDNAQRYLDMAGTMLLVINEDQQVSLVNRRGCEILGLEEDKIIGKNWFDKFIPEGLREQVKEVFDSLIRGEIEPVEYFENTVLDSSGHERLIAWHNTVLRDESGRIYATLGSGEDITERIKADKALRESEARWRSFLANAPDLISVADRAGTIQYINHVPAGLTIEEAQGKKIYDFIPEEYHGTIRQSLAKLFETGEPSTLEIQARGPHDRPAWYITSIGPIRQEGRVVSAMMTSSDITERKRAEEALRESELRYRTFVENMQGIAFQGEMDFKPYFFHGAVEEITGYGEEEFLNGSIRWDNLIPPEDMPKIREEAGKVHTIPEYCYADEHRIIRKDGRVSWVFETVRNICDEEGKPYMVQGAIYDINRRKVMEEALRESETRYRNFVESFQGIAFRGSIGFVPEFFHGAVEEITGYTEDEFKASSPRWDQIIHEEDLPLLREKFSEISTTANCTQERVYRIIRKDGETRWVQEIIQSKSNGSPAPRYVEGVIFDITRKKLAEDALIEREEKISMLLGSTAEGIYGLDMDGNCTFCNPAAARLLGYESAESFIGSNMHDLIHHSHEDGSTYEAENCPIHRAFTSGEHIHVDDEVLWRPDGSSFYAEYWSYPIIKDNDIVGAVVTFIDVSDRKKADELYSSVVRTAQDAFWLCDIEGNIQDVNEAACRLYGYSREEFIGMHPRDIDTIESPEEVALHTKRIQENGGAIFESRHRTKGGSIIDVEISLVFLGHLGGATFAFMRDISDRKEIENERLRTQKFETIGLMAGGIAHDFNNILTIIKNNLSLAKMYTSKGGVVYEKLSEALEEFSQARSLTQQLLTFSKGRSPIMMATTIESMLTHSVVFSLRGSNVQPRFHINGPVPMVKVDKDQFNQVINNIVINSKQSMPEGGFIDIVLEGVTLPDDHGLPLEGDRYVKLSIADTGTGIPKEIIDRIFDPYFTTKEGGNGFGLSTTYSIINNHKGHIFVESEEGKGSFFHIYLPVCDESASSDSLKEENGMNEDSTYSVSPLNPGIKGRVLIMDDEWKILKSMGSLLGLSGYRVNYAADGERAIRLYEEAQEAGKAYDAVIMDLTVPGGMGGLEAVKILRQLDPEAKAIVSSGYSSEPVISRYREYGFDGAVAKPYDIEELVAALDSILLKDQGVQGDIKHE